MKLSQPIALLLVLVSGLCFAAFARSNPPTLYQVTNLGTVSGKTAPNARGINDLGEITGNTSTGGSVFLWTAQTGMQDLGIPDGFDSATGVAINDNGQIAVDADKLPASSFLGHAYRWDSGVFQDLGTLGGSFSTAYGIDASGRVAGYAHTPFPSDIHAVRSTTGTSFLDIDSLGGNHSLGYGINGSGSVVGQAKTTGGEYHAFLWPGSGDMQDLETLDGTQSQANGISDSGIVVGGSSTSGGSYHAFIWQNGTMSDLGSPTAFSSRGLAVNDSGVVIGSYSDGVNSHPFVWNSTTGIQDLNGLLAPISGADWTLLTVSDINNHGQIVGQGFHNGVVSAFLLTPVPEPSALLLMTVGVLVSCMARRRGSSNEAGRLIDDFRRVRILR